MGKRKFFFLFILAGGLLIFLQQDSLSWNHNYNLNRTNITQNENKLGHSKSFVIRENFVDDDEFSSKLKKILINHKTAPRHKTLLDGFNPLARFPIYTGANVSRVLLLAYFRSGSSFVGDLMQQNWKSFYSFEPLHLMTRYTRIDDTNLTKALNLITSIYDCDFASNSYYVKWIEKNQFLLKWNKFLWNVCRFRSQSCFDPKYMRQACRRSKYNIIKIVRMPMKHLHILWKQIAPLNVKVAYLVRDPRGIYNSRKNMEWCNKDVCANLASICSEMRQDIEEYDQLKAIMGDNLVMVRYEDISMDPLNGTKQLFAQLKIEFSSSVLRFVRTHTKAYPHFHHRQSDVENPYSTYRANSSTTALQWMRELNGTEIEFAQTNCSDILSRFRYPIL
ncbi:hypothetical protein BLOT_001820 [Blomia tropicalis]|nr:hypothetical protein BLOT_001820 [Blomia tropicalis]